MSVAKKSNPALWERAKSQAKARMGGKHSARAMQLAVSIYKKAGGKYKGAKTSSNKLAKWTKEKWTTSSGKPSEGKRRYLPKHGQHYLLQKNVLPMQQKLPVIKRVSSSLLNQNQSLKK
jgi:hypothetical protein